MYTVDLYLRVRLACHVDGLSQREAASRFGIARETVRKMLRHSEPPGYRRRQPPKRPKLAPFTDIIDRILEEDRTVHRKQHHTAKRIFERLRDEHGFTGKETIVKDYVRERRLRRREMFVPLSHPPGHAQADFGEADAIIAGVKYRAHFFVMTLPHSDACFVAAYPAATTEAWLDGHNRAFVFFGGVPQSILYDNDKCLVSRILSDGTRQRTRAFSGLQSHYLFEDRYGRPGKGNDKGNVEGVVGYARRNFMTPLPRFASWDAFNGHLEEQCRNRQGNVLRGHRESIGERFVRDREALKRPLPAPFDACDKQGTRVHPEYQSRPAHGWFIRSDKPAIKATTGRQRLNLHGALDLETMKLTLVEGEKINAETSLRLFEKLERAYPDTRVIPGDPCLSRQCALSPCQAVAAVPGAAGVPHPAAFPAAVCATPQSHRAVMGRHAPACDAQPVLSRFPTVHRGHLRVLQPNPAPGMGNNPRHRYRQLSCHHTRSVPSNWVAGV